LRDALRFFGLALLLVATAPAADYGRVTTHKVAEGVYLFTTTPYADVGFCGNVVAVVGDRGVLVFDSGATPRTAEAIIAELRRVTDQPVRYLVNSHWHWDHWGGNQAFAAASPGLQIITSKKNLQMMKEVEPRWNEKGLNEDLPHFVADQEKQLAEAKAKHSVPAERLTAAEARVAADRDFLTQKQSVRKTYPTVTFTEPMTVRLGKREAQVLSARAITPGDTYVYLPRDKILITGDIVLNPYPYAIGGTYPAEWSQTLTKLVALNPAIVIPGHGDVAGKQLLLDNVKLFEAVRQRVREARQKKMTVDDSVKAIDADAATLAALVGVTSVDKVDEFKSYFLETFVRRAYRELDGALGDSPDGLK
jgi:cyclase